VSDSPANRVRCGDVCQSSRLAGFIASVSRGRVFLFYWLPPVAWMSLIFWGSTDRLSVSNTSRFLGPLIHWLLPQLADEQVGNIVLILRKCAHTQEYLLLTALAWRALRQERWRDPRPWSWGHAAGAWSIAVAYAATDEFHQTFTATRGGSVTDVCIDAFGATMGVTLLWLLHRLTGRWRRRKTPAGQVLTTAG
jgi:VanZ family protein